MPPLVSQWNEVWETSAEIPNWWRVTTQIWGMLLIGRAAWEICFSQSEALSSSGAVTRHQYGISALVSQTSFCRETCGGIAKCWLFSQAIKKQTKPWKLYLISRKLTWLTQLDLVTAQGPEWFQNTWRSHSWEPHTVYKRSVSSKLNWINLVLFAFSFVF